MKEKVVIMPEGRKCKKCGMPLSIYNPTEQCFSHSFPKDHGMGNTCNCTSGICGGDFIRTQLEYQGSGKE